MASRTGLRCIAITDHDTMQGIPEAREAAQGTSLRVVAGVEISCECEAACAEVHILGYFVSPDDAPVREALERSRGSRVGRAKAMLDKLRAMGIELSWDRVRELAGDGAIGRPHIAAALREARVVDSTQEAFDRYLSHSSPAYVPRAKVEPATAISLIHGAGGVAVLAHPWGLERKVPALAAQGLDGLEVYYAGYSSEVHGYLLRLARQYRLACAGGSDFHGLGIMPDRPLGAAPVPECCLAELEMRRPC